MTTPDLTPRVLETPRLRLRPFAFADAAEVKRLAGDAAIADTTLQVPHPYPEGLAEAWILDQGDALARGETATFALTRRDDGALVGAMGLALALDHQRAELGYWVGVPFWNRGYATEAAEAVLGHGFGAYGLHRVAATHLTRNGASCRVMEKLGMRVEGISREHVLKNGRFEDLERHAILADEWHARGR